MAQNENQQETESILLGAPLFDADQDPFGKLSQFGRDMGELAKFPTNQRTQELFHIIPETKGQFWPLLWSSETIRQLAVIIM